MIVGISNDNYPEKRSIMVGSNARYINFKTSNYYYYLNFLYAKVFRQRKKFLFKPLPVSPKGGVDIFHLFNEVALTDKKWVATFETELPRILPPKKGVKSDNLPALEGLAPAILSSNCLALIALSDAAYQMEKKLYQHRPDLSKLIMDKTLVMHPPQKLHLTTRAERSADAPVHFVFIGKEFYRKGGGEVVQAFAELLDEGKIQAAQIKVTLIGDVEKRHNYAHGSFQDDAQFSTLTESALSRYDVFSHVSAMPNSQVIELLKQTDVGLLPTWAETYGFSVLEMQSCGCPVITTNVRALPEINPASAGWQIVNPLNDDLDYGIHSAQEREALRRNIVDQLKTIVTDILNHPEQINLKARASIERIQKEHDLTHYQQKLASIYQR